MNNRCDGISSKLYIKNKIYPNQYINQSSVYKI